MNAVLVIGWRVKLHAPLHVTIYDVFLTFFFFKRKT